MRRQEPPRAVEVQSLDEGARDLVAAIRGRDALALRVACESMTRVADLTQHIETSFALTARLQQLSLLKYLT